MFNFKHIVRVCAELIEAVVENDESSQNPIESWKITSPLKI